MLQRLLNRGDATALELSRGERVLQIHGTKPSENRSLPCCAGRGMPGINMVPPVRLASPRQRTEQPVSIVLYMLYRTMDTLKTTSSGHWSKPYATQRQGVQQLEANQASRSSALWKSSRASARVSSCSRRRDWMRAVVDSLRGPQRRVRRRMVTLVAPVGGLLRGPPDGLPGGLLGGLRPASPARLGCGGSPRGEYRRSP